MNATENTGKPKRQNAAFKHIMILHWIMAAFTLLLYVTGVLVAHPHQSHLLIWLIPSLHQSFGMLVVLLLIARIFLLLRLFSYRYSKRSPKVTFRWLQTIILHGSLYFFMLIAPVSGFFLRNLIGLDTTFFGIPVPSVFAPNETWGELARSSHFWLSYVFLAFIFLHILGHWKMIWINARKRFVDFAKASSRKG